MTQLHPRFEIPSIVSNPVHQFLFLIQADKFTEAAHHAVEQFTLVFSQALTLVAMVRLETEGTWRGITNHSERRAYCDLLSTIEKKTTTADIMRGVKTRDDALVFQFALSEQENFVTALAMAVVRDFSTSARDSLNISEEHKCMNQLLAKECMVATPQQMVLKLLQTVDEISCPCSKFYPQILAFIIDRLYRRHTKVYMRAIQCAYDLRRP